MKALIISGHLTDAENKYGGVVKSLPGFVADLKNIYLNVSILGISESKTALNPMMLSMVSDTVLLKNHFNSRHSFTIEFLKVFLAIKRHDLIILNGYHNFVLTVALIFTIFLRKPFAIHFRGGLEKTRLKFGNSLLKKFWNSVFLRFLLERSTKIYCSTRKEANDICSIYENIKNKNKFHIVPNWREHLELSCKCNHQEIHNCLLYFGRISAQKGIFEILDAVLSIKDIALVVVGPIEHSDRRRFLQKIKNAPNISYFASMPIEKIADTFCDKVDALIAASSSENFGNVFSEASEMHLPIISSKVGVLNELKPQNDFIEILGSRSPDDIVTAIEKFYLLDAAARIQMTLRAKRKLLNSC